MFSPISHYHGFAITCAHCHSTASDPVIITFHFFPSHMPLLLHINISIVCVFITVCGNDFHILGTYWIRQ